RSGSYHSGAHADGGKSFDAKTGWSGAAIVDFEIDLVHSRLEDTADGAVFQPTKAGLRDAGIHTVDQNRNRIIRCDAAGQNHTGRIESGEVKVHAINIVAATGVAARIKKRPNPFGD